MKRAKRFLSVLLSLCLTLGLIPGTAFAASGDFPFTDVNTSDWCYDAVQYAHEKGMMNGTSETTFSPGRTTTRGMIVTILHRLEGTPAASGTAFADVPASSYCADAVAWASANGIVGGYGNGTFGPGNIITREQMATILYRYSQYKGYDVSKKDAISGFSDSAQVGAFAEEAMSWAIGTGLISGVSSTALAPKGNTTRAQAATILMRYCENVVPASAASDVPEEGTYTVTFDLNYSGSSANRVTVNAGETVSKPANPSRSGYSFGGWYIEKSGGRQFDFKQAITEDLTLYAHWSSTRSSGGGGSQGGSSSSGTNSFTVTFNANGGAASSSSLTVTSGAAIGTLPTATWAGHTFLGWYTAVSGGTQVTAATTITGNITVYAHWQEGGNVYNVWFLESDGTQANTTPNPQTVAPGNRAFSQQAFKAGNTLAGWYTDAGLTTEYNFDTAVVADLNLYAKWVPAESDVRITINTGDYENTVFNRKFNVTVETEISSVDTVRYTLVGSGENLLADETLDENVGQGTFPYDVDVRLDNGTNTFTVIVTTSDGNEVRESVNVTYDDGNIFDFGSIEDYEAAGTRMIPVYEDEADEEPAFYVMANIIRLFFTEDSTTAQREEAIASIGTKVGSISATDLWQVKLPEDITDKERLTYDEYDELMAEIEERYATEGSIIESAELGEFYIFEDSEYVSNDGWDITHDDWWLTYIDADDAWEYDNHYNSDYLTRITVGVVDGGFLTTHNDLNGNIRLLDSDYNVADDHGTHVAGIIGAMADNGEGGAGVTHNTGASRNSTIVAYDAGDGNGYSKDSLQLGLNRTVAAGAKVINFSIGSSKTCNGTDRSGSHLTSTNSYSKAMGKLLEKGSDFVVVQSAGNGDTKTYNGDSYNTHGIAYWGVNSLFRSINTDNCYHSAKVSKDDIIGRILVVSNVKNNTGVLNITSNGYATDGSDGDLNVIAAPGTDIYSSVTTGNPPYDSYTGTSMAAPVVSGVCSMVWSVNKKMNGKNVVDILMDTTQGTAQTNTTDTAAQVLGGGTSHASGGMGVVNAKNAVEEAIKTLPRQESNVIDATTGRGIPGAKIVVKNSRGQIVGNPTGTIYAAQDGSFTTFDWGLPAGSYTLTVSAEGYADTVVPWRITNLYPHRVVTYPNILLSTELDANNYRIILTWGEDPMDLDSHLVADAVTGDAVHVYYANQDPNPHYVNLDVDDVTSYGPETITITNFEGLRNIRYAVHDYTNRSQSVSMAMSSSGASVQIYKGNTLLRTYHVPLLAPGTVWEVFAFDASGNIVPINRMSYCTDPSAVLGGSDAQLLEAEMTPLKDYEIAEAAENPAETEDPAVENPAESEEPTVENPAESEEPTVENPAETEEPTVENPAESEEPAVENPTETEKPELGETANDNP